MRQLDDSIEPGETLPDLGEVTSTNGGPISGLWPPSGGRISRNLGSVSGSDLGALRLYIRAFNSLTLSVLTSKMGIIDDASSSQDY